MSESASLKQQASAAKTDYDVAKAQYAGALSQLNGLDPDNKENKDDIDSLKSRVESLTNKVADRATSYVDLESQARAAQIKDDKNELNKQIEDEEKITKEQQEALAKQEEMTAEELKANRVSEELGLDTVDKPEEEFLDFLGEGNQVQPADDEASFSPINPTATTTGSAIEETNAEETEEIKATAGSSGTST